MNKTERINTIEVLVRSVCFVVGLFQVEQLDLKASADVMQACVGDSRLISVSFQFPRVALGTLLGVFYHKTILMSSGFPICEFIS